MSSLKTSTKGTQMNRILLLAAATLDPDFKILSLWASKLCNLYD